MPNTYINRVDVVEGGTPRTLIDLTSDTVTAATLMQGYTAHDASGAPITGTASGSLTVNFTFDDEADPPIWVPDKTFAQVKAAYDRGDAIVLSAPDTEGNDNLERMYHQDEDVVFEMPETFYMEILWFDYEMVVTPEGSDGWEYDQYQLTSEGGWELQGRTPLDYQKVLIEKTFTANGVYDPMADYTNFSNGYSLVTVNVPKTTLQPLTVTPSTTQQVFSGSVQMGAEALYSHRVRTNATVTFTPPKFVEGTDYWVKVTSYNGNASTTAVREYDPVLWTATSEYKYLADGYLGIRSTSVRNQSMAYSYLVEIYPVSGSTAYSPVTVEPIPSQYVVPTGNIAITANGTVDVSQYATASVDVPSGVDTSQDTVDAAHLLQGYTAHDSTGAQITGSYVAPTFSTQAKAATPTESAQTIQPDSGYDGLSEVTVGAIPSTYVGSGVTQRTSSDLTASGATVTVPAGHYASAASKAVATGTEGTPTATKGTVSNHVVTVTPSVTNSEGYVAGGTHAGTPVTVQASELVSGTKAITGSGTTDVTDYASASVAAGSATASATKGAVSNHSVTVTPSVTRTAGWVTAGTANGTPVTVQASELVSGSTTITENGAYDVTDLAEVVVDVPTGGTAMNVQAAQSTTRATSTSYTEVISLTCDTAGTYDVYWTTFRSSTSGTWGSQLYLDNSAYGSAQTGSWSNHVQNVHLTGVTIAAGEEVSVRVRSRGSNYYGYVGTLTIIQTA